MNITTIEKFSVAGISVRTKNSNEMSPSTAKIGSLWEKFYGELAPKLNQNARVFGLYTNYESDHTGLFDVVACSDSLLTENVEKHDVKAGNYVKFKAAGEMPQVVIDLWGAVWKYFDANDCDYKRTFTTDFEFYKSENEVEIFISVE
ncbi:GyrI-like domain-containing protein [Alteromonas sp. ASW11-130]|uniref:GyrI-like domain-containing protein n=1 Tax=Alteromonas sp. ASW11-130 TaxID=3015775 RepID=UPI0022427662|nr:GyrI-like domain-containing protein [Alteromonas sp. ASW11-130]